MKHSASVSVARVYSALPRLNSALWKNWKEPSSSAISVKVSFCDDSNKEVLNVNKFLSAIIEKKWNVNYIQTLPAQVQ